MTYRELSYVPSSVYYDWGIVCQLGHLAIMPNINVSCYKIKLDF